METALNLIKLPFELQEYVCEYAKYKKKCILAKICARLALYKHLLIAQNNLGYTCIKNIQVYQKMYIDTCIKRGINCMIREKNLYILDIMLQTRLRLTHKSVHDIIISCDLEFIKILTKYRPISPSWKIVFLQHNQADIYNYLVDNNRLSDDEELKHQGRIGIYVRNIVDQSMIQETIFPFEMLRPEELEEYIKHPCIFAHHSFDIFKKIYKYTIDQADTQEYFDNNTPPYTENRFIYKSGASNRKYSKQDMLEILAINSGQQAVEFLRAQGIPHRFQQIYIIASTSYSLEYYKWYVDSHPDSHILEINNDIVPCKYPNVYRQECLACAVYYDRLDLVDYFLDCHRDVNCTTRIRSYEMIKKLERYMKLDYSSIMSDTISEFKHIPIDQQKKILEYCHSQGGKSPNEFTKLCTSDTFNSDIKRYISYLDKLGRYDIFEFLCDIGTIRKGDFIYIQSLQYVQEFPLSMEILDRLYENIPINVLVQHIPHVNYFWEDAELIHRIYMTDPEHEYLNSRHGDSFHSALYLQEYTVKQYLEYQHAGLYNLFEQIEN